MTSGHRPDIRNEDLLALRKQGLSNKEIAAKVGVTQRTVYTRIGKASDVVDGRKGRKTPHETEELLALRKQGLSNKEIAEKLGIHVSTVRRQIGNQPESLDKRRGGVTHADDTDVQKLYESGMSKSAIATKLGVSLGTVNRRLQSPAEDTPVEPQKAPSEPLETKETQVVTFIPATPQNGQRIASERLYDFADTPGWVMKLEELARIAQPETWQLANPDPDKVSRFPQVEILSNYINNVFSLLVRAYNAAAESELDNILYIRDEYCCFHTGLYTPGYRGLYALFMPNRRGCMTRTGRRLLGFFAEGHPDLGRVAVLPSPPPRSQMPLFDPCKLMRICTTHITYRADGKCRLPETVQKYWNVELLLETAVEFARRKAAAEPDSVVYSPRPLDAQYLLPLYLTNSDTPDLAALVSCTAEGYYLCKTVLTLNQAYLHARVCGKITAEWLLRAVEHGGGEPRGVRPDEH